MSDKTERATPYKLQKAKEKGQVNKSMELTNTVFLFISVMVGIALFPLALHQIRTMMIALFSLENSQVASIDKLIKLEQFLFAKMILLWLPFAVSCMLAVILVTIVQTGFVWSTTPLVPDFKRLHIVQGLKRFITLKLVFETAKTSLKLILALSIVTLSFSYELKRLFELIILHPQQHPGLILSLMLKLSLQLLTVVFTLAILDKGYTTWKYRKDQRMSKQEVKEEYRQREGDPKIKAKIKQLQQQLRLKTSALNQVKTADVLITNPTHLAIALKYDRNLMPAPKVVCKAQGELVYHAKKLAQRHLVPIIQHKTFAQSLFASVELNQWIGSEHFATAALIFREIYQQRGKQ